MRNKKKSLPQHNIVCHGDHTNILQQKLWQCNKKQKPQHKVARKKVSLKETYLAYT
jgi:hypothetical protein